MRMDFSNDGTCNVLTITLSEEVQECMTDGIMG